MVLELGAFGAVVALRGAPGRRRDRGLPRHRPPGTVGDRCARRGARRPGRAAAGAGWAVRQGRPWSARCSTGGAAWLAVVVALNAVVGLAYYVRVAADAVRRSRRRTRRTRSPTGPGGRSVVAVGRGRGDGGRGWWSASRRSWSSTPRASAADPARPGSQPSSQRRRGSVAVADGVEGAAEPLKE